MNALALVEQFRVAVLAGRRAELAYPPPASASDISDLEDALGSPIPADLRALWMSSSSSNWMFVPALWDPYYATETTEHWKMLVDESDLSPGCVLLDEFVVFGDNAGAVLMMLDGPDKGAIVWSSPQQLSQPTILAGSLDAYLETTVALARAGFVKIIESPVYDEGCAPAWTRAFYRSLTDGTDPALGSLGIQGVFR